jgi:hypothetical protein
MVSNGMEFEPSEIGKSTPLKLFFSKEKSKSDHKK